MTAAAAVLVCAWGKCDKPLTTPTTGRAPRYCSSSHRLAAFRAARSREQSSDTPIGTPRNESSPRPSYRRARCPVDAAHGPVLDWPTARWGWHCPHHDHDGRPASHPLGELAPSRAFFTTAEVDAGSVTPTPRAAQVPIPGQPEAPVRVPALTLDAGGRESPLAVIPAPHRTSDDRTRPGPGGPSSDPASLRAPDGDSSAARPELGRRSHPAADPGQRGTVQLPLLSG
jgi:hypothetical protein